MTATLPPAIKFQPLVGGVPLPGGKVKFYEAGTTTSQTVYAADGATPIGSEIILDANGATSFRLGAGLAYKIDLFDVNDVHQVGWPEDNVQDLASFAVMLTDLASTASGKGSALVAYNPAVTYPAGSVGKVLADNAALDSGSVTPAASRVVKSKADGTIDTAWLPTGKTTTNVYAYGDSITAGVGTSVPANSYANLLSTAMGWTLSNNAISGGSIPDWIVPCHNQPVADDGIAFIMPGFNDLRFIGTTKSYYAAYQNALYAACAYLAIPDSKKIKGNDARITYVGSWSANPVTSYGKYTITLNDTASFQISGSVLYICTIQQAGQGGLLNVVVDGVDQGTYDLNQPVQNGGSVSSITYTPMLIRIPGLGDGAHNVVVKNVGKDATSGSTSTYLDWVAGSGPVGNTSARVFLTNTLRMNATGAAGGAPYNHASDPVTAAFCKMAEGVASDLAADGLQVMYIDATSYYDPNTSDVATDNIHPSDIGHAKIATAIQAQIKRYLQPNMVTAGTNAVRMAAPSPWRSCTPTMKGSGTAGTHTYTTQEGSYTISGKICTYAFRLVVATVGGTMAGATCITLPPNAPLSINGKFHTGVIGKKTGISLSASCTNLYGEVSGAVDPTVIFIRQAHPTTETELPVGNLSNGMEIRGTISYPVD